MSLISITHKLHRPTDPESLVVIVHGASQGIDSAFMANIFETFADNHTSVALLQMPYIDRNETRSLSDELGEEVSAVVDAISLLKSAEYESIILIGKSLGGVVLSKVLNSLDVLKTKDISFGVFGWIPSATELPIEQCRVVVVQGSQDPFCSPHEVTTLFHSNNLSDSLVIPIDGGDHSYRSEDGTTPLQRVAIQKMYDALK